VLNPPPPPFAHDKLKRVRTGADPVYPYILVLLC
jgi:hypothetical protein